MFPGGHRVSSVGVVVITSALHAVGHGFETHTEYSFSSVVVGTSFYVNFHSHVISTIAST
jgi:hypothetical protein